MSWKIWEKKFKKNERLARKSKVLNTLVFGLKPKTETKGVILGLT